jgi:hypothetical protein
MGAIAAVVIGNYGTVWLILRKLSGAMVQNWAIGL